MTNHKAILTGNVKRILSNALKEYLSQDPNYLNLKVVNRKSDIPKLATGIYFSNISATPFKMSADNYIGLVESYVSLARLNPHPSQFIDLVREDDGNMFRQVKDEDVSSQVDGVNIKFQVQNFPILKQSVDTGDISVSDLPDTVKVLVDGVRVEVSSLDGRTGLVTLAFPPPVDSEVTISYLYRRLVPRGHYIMQVLAKSNNASPNQVAVGKFPGVDDFPLPFRMDEVRLTFPEGYLDDNPVKLFVDGDELLTGFEVHSNFPHIVFNRRPQGNLFEVRDSLTDTPLESLTLWKFKRFKELVLTSYASGHERDFPIPDLSFEEESLKVYKNNTLLIPKDYLSGDDWDYEVRNYRIYLRTKASSTAEYKATYLIVDQDPRFEVPVSEIFDDATRFEIFSSFPLLPGFIEVKNNFSTMYASEDMEMDFSNKVLTLLRIPTVNERLFVTYRMNAGTIGPFDVSNFGINNSILPGVVIYFNNRFSVGDKISIIVGDQRKLCADEFGGKYTVNVDLSIVSSDPMTTEDLTDEVLVFLNGILKPHFDAFGVFMEEASLGGEADEQLDTSTGDTDFQTTISTTLFTDWFLRIPRKVLLTSLVANTKPDASSEWSPRGRYLPDFSTSKYFYYKPERI